MHVTGKPSTGHAFNGRQDTQAQQRVLVALGIKPTTAKQLSAQHGDAVYQALLAKNAPLKLKTDDQDEVTIKNVGYQFGDVAKRAIQPNFAALAQALAKEAPRESLDLLKAALNASFKHKATREAVQDAYQNALTAQAAQNEAPDESHSALDDPEDSSSRVSLDSSHEEPLPALTLSPQALAVQHANKDPLGAMRTAIESGDANLARAAIPFLADPNAVMANGLTPLQFAARQETQKLSTCCCSKKAPNTTRPTCMDGPRCTKRSAAHTPTSSAGCCSARPSPTPTVHCRAVKRW